MGQGRGRGRSHSAGKRQGWSLKLSLLTLNWPSLWWQHALSIVMRNTYVGFVLGCRHRSSSNPGNFLIGVRGVSWFILNKTPSTTPESVLMR